jgi:hypothetical protein
MEFRQYQKKIIEEGLSVLKTHRFLYLGYGGTNRENFNKFGISRPFKL